jgi:hypothetical protein
LRAGAPVCPCIRTETLSNFITTVSTCQRPAQNAATAIRNTAERIHRIGC